MEKEIYEICFCLDGRLFPTKHRAKTVALLVPILDKKLKRDLESGIVGRWGIFPIEEPK